MLRAAALCLIGTLAACNQTATKKSDPMQEIRASSAARDEEAYQNDMQAKASADTRSSPAKGTKTCLIKQSTSAHRTAQYRKNSLSLGVSIHLSQSSNIHFKVTRGGSVGLAVSESTYPGKNSYFLIGERRFNADGDHYADVSAALPALRRDPVIKYTWHDWPYRAEINQEDVFAGFEAAYQECVAFLKT